MTWLGTIAAVIGLYLAYKAAGMVLRLALWLVIGVAAYWWLAPIIGWPPIEDVIRVLGP